MDVLCLVAQMCPTFCDTMDCSWQSFSVHGDSPGKKTGVGCRVLLQGILPAQGSNPGLLHRRWIIYLLSHQGSSGSYLQRWILASKWCIFMKIQCAIEGGNRTGSILKGGLHLGLDCGLRAICLVSMETAHQLENQAHGRKSPRAFHCLKEYCNYLCNGIESYILLCLLGYDHKPIDNCPLLTT